MTNYHENIVEFGVKCC